VRDAEGGGERSEPPALPRGAKRRGDCRSESEDRSSPTRAKRHSQIGATDQSSSLGEVKRRSNLLIGGVVVPLRLLHFVRNDN